MLKSTLDDQDYATVTLNRPSLQNAFDEIIIFELTGLFSNLAVNLDLRLILLNANGKSFCAGADLNWIKRMAVKDLIRNIYKEPVDKDILDYPAKCIAAIRATTEGKVGM